jgi:hypothetical protein
MRRAIQAVWERRDPGDVSTVVAPSTLAHVREALARQESR